MLRMISLFASVLMLFSCHQEEKYFSLNGRTQGTSYHIIYSVKDSTDYTMQIDSILETINSNFSLWDTNSVVSRINRNTFNEPLNPVFIRLFNFSKEVYANTNGAFDPTIAPLIDMWGFGVKKNKHIDTTQLEKIKTLVGFNKIRIKNNLIVKDNPAITLNFNSIAQGFTVDLLAELFDKNGLNNYVIEVGGEVRVKGVNDRKAIWTVGIDNPVENNLTPGSNLNTILILHNLSTTTSGNYRNFIVENGVKYSHIINPKTGYPSKNNLLSATVISKDCLTADGYDTALMVVGLDEAIRIAQKLKLEIYLIYSDEKGNYKTYMSEKTMKRIKN